MAAVDGDSRPMTYISHSGIERSLVTWRKSLLMFNSSLNHDEVNRRRADGDPRFNHKRRALKIFFF